MTFMVNLAFYVLATTLEFRDPLGIYHVLRLCATFDV